MSFPAEKVIGGQLHPGKYALVEFMDYECPPCRAQKDKVKNIVQLYGGKLTLHIRHYPLSFHPNAETASAAAEAARSQGKFWQMHDKLFESSRELNEREILRIAQSLALNIHAFRAEWKHDARKKIKTECEAAEAIGVTGTPTFYLCTPEGTVWRLDNIGQVHSLIK